MFICISLVGAASLFALAAPGATGNRPDRVVVGFELKSNLIVIDTRVNGASKRFVRTRERRSR